MTLKQRRSIFSLNFAKLIIWINEQPGYTCGICEVMRTPEQAAIYAKKGVGIIHSLHLDSCAGDLAIWLNGVYVESTDGYKFAGDYWESLHPQNRWGGRFKDGDHFEMREVINLG